MAEGSEHLGGSLWQVKSSQGEHYELRGPNSDHSQILPSDMRLTDALENATEFENQFYELELSDAAGRDASQSFGVAHWGDAWQNSPGKEFVAIIKLNLDQLSEKQKRRLEATIFKLTPQKIIDIEQKNVALDGLSEALKKAREAQELLAKMPARPLRRSFAESANHPHQLSVQLSRSLTMLQRDYCYELGRIKRVRNPANLEKHRLLFEAVKAYLLWLPEGRPISGLGFRYHPDWQNIAKLTVVDSAYRKPFGDFLDSFTDNAAKVHEAYEMNPRSPTFQKTIKEALATLSAD